MNRGEIWLMNPGDSGGHEQLGTRPAAIFSDVIAHIVMVVPLTSNTRSLRFVHTVEILPNSSNNLSVPSVAMVFQLRALDVKKLERKIGTLSAGEVKLLGREIKKMLKV